MTTSGDDINAPILGSPVQRLEKEITPEHHQLNQIAEDCLSLKGVIDVELFGSFARDEEHDDSDYDLVLVVDEERAQAWMDEVLTNLGSFNSECETDGSVTLERYWATSSIFSAFRHILSWDHEIDIFVFPPNWKSEETLNNLQIAGQHKDPNFMHNIACDAITYNSATGSFPWRN